MSQHLFGVTEPSAPPPRAAFASVNYWTYTRLYRAALCRTLFLVRPSLLVPPSSSLRALLSSFSRDLQRQPPRTPSFDTPTPCPRSSLARPSPRPRMVSLSPAPTLSQTFDALIPRSHCSTRSSAAHRIISSSPPRLLCDISPVFPGLTAHHPLFCADCICGEFIVRLLALLPERLTQAWMFEPPSGMHHTVSVSHTSPALGSSSLTRA